MSDYLYDAFISYSHRDMRWGKWLQRRLETYRAPKDLLDGRDAGQKLRVFRDQTDLAGVELQTSLRKELDVSRYLIVLCSPNSASSPWVNDEVLYFISLGRVDRIIPFIVDGEPNSENPSLECYPAALREVTGFTHLGANVKEIGRSRAFLKLISIILDVRFNRLVDRERQRKIRNGLAIGLGSAVIILTGSILIWRNTVVSRRNHELSYDIYGAVLASISQKEDMEPGDVDFLRASAEEGNADAILLLADCYLNGWGTEKNFEEAFRWSQKGAEAGDETCMMFLGNCYFNGTGTECNPEMSFFWYMKAAEAGYAPGMQNVAACYEDGFGVEADGEKAFEWYQKSAEAGNDLGMFNLALCYQKGTGTEPNKEMSFFWMKKLAETGNPIGMYNIGLMYQYGYGTEEDPKAAYTWYRKAADAGEPEGAYMTGWCWENHYGTGDPAEEWYEKARELGREE